MRVLFFVLSGLFCCLGFLVVNCFCCFGRGRVLFCCLGGGPGPAQTAKKKKKHAPAPSKHVCFLLFGRVVVGVCCLGRGVFFFAIWAGVVFLFLLFGRVAVFFFLLFGEGGGGGRFFFCCLGRVRVFFCCLGRGRVFLFAVWAGDGNSLTYRSAWLFFKRPNNKKTTNSKQKTRFTKFGLREKHFYPDTSKHGIWNGGLQDSLTVWKPTHGSWFRGLKGSGLLSNPNTPKY